MENKLKALFFFLGLFVVAHGLIAEPETWGNYQKCFTFGNCLADGSGFQKISSCINEMKPEEIKLEFQNIVNDYKWNSNNLFDVLKEYCRLDADKKPEAFRKSFDGIAAYIKKVCTDESKKAQCTRVSQNMDCLFGYLNDLQKDGKC